MNKNAKFRDLSTRLSHNCSRKVSDYESIKKRLSVVNKSMYKTGLVYDPIALLEKSAITGRIFDKTEPKPKKKKKNPPDSLTVLLRSEHKNKEGIQIYQLPKLPFGSHKSYNEENQFVRQHFKFGPCNDDLSKNLEILTRKFRLNDKNHSKRAQSSHLKKRKKDFQNSDFFKMESGYLICKKEKEITDIYEKDKTRFENEIAPVTNKKIETEPLEKDSKFEKNQKKNFPIKKIFTADIVSRLYPTKEDSESPVTKFYKTKYSALFSDAEVSTRPVTSFQIKSWKM